MHIIAVGINYKTAPVEIREKLAFTESELLEAMSTLKDRKSILENVILSTCNRTVIFAVVDQLHTGRYFIQQFLSDWFSIDKEIFAPYIVSYENESAVEHIFRLSCGLESMIVGETQILGQIRNVFLEAQANKLTGTIFNELFKQAITFGKRCQRDTAINENAVSVSYAAVELAKQTLSDIKNKHIAIIGAGKMGELAAKNLYGAGANQVTVINRTKEKAERLAEQFNGIAKTTEELSATLSDVDIVISSTGARGYVVTKQHIEKALEQRNKPLFLIDIAVPRDIDPSIKDLENIHLYDIDDLYNTVDQNLESRKEAAKQIEEWIGEEIEAFYEWVQTLGVVPIINALREKALAIQKETMDSIERKIPDLTDRERKVLNKHTKSIVNQLLKQPILQAKDLAGEPNAEEALALFMRIFAIDESVYESAIQIKNTTEKKSELSMINS